MGVNFFFTGNHHQFSGAVCWGPAASLCRVGTLCNHYLKRNHFICHDVRNLPVCARLSECETVVCLRLNYILSKNHDSYFRFISWRWKYHCQTRRVTCTISTRPAVLTLKLVSEHALKEITLYLLLNLADILWGRIAWWSKRRSVFEASGVSAGTVKTHREDNCKQKFATLYPKI